MKNSTAYAAKIKKLTAQLKRAKPKPIWPESDGPLDQLMFAAMSEGTNPTKARAALNRIVEAAIDLNDLRVSTPQELAALVEDVLPNCLDRTKALVRILHSLYERENTVTIDGLKGKGKRDTRAYLESLEGATPYIVGCTILWGLNDHAIALDEHMLNMLRKDDLVDAAADIHEVQRFLERQVPAADAKVFTMVLKRQAAQRSVHPPARSTKKSVAKS